MAQLISHEYGYIEAVLDANGNPYPAEDFRSRFYNIPGTIMVYESKKKAPGKHFAYFFPNESSNTNQRYLRTSPGEMEEGEKTIVIRTGHSTYRFRVNDNCLSKEEKEALDINAARCLFG